MIAPNKLDGVVMTDEQIDALAEPFLTLGDGDTEHDSIDWRGFAHALLSASKPAAPAQSGEPVAWLCEWPGDDGQTWVYAHANELSAIDQQKRRPDTTITPLYAASQPFQPVEAGEPVSQLLADDCGGAWTAFEKSTNSDMSNRDDLWPVWQEAWETARAQSAVVVLDDERAAFETALRETYAMVDPLNPPPAGSYYRGQHEGIIAALETMRDNFDRAASQQPEQAEWALIREAMRSLSTRADELKASNTSFDGTWCDAAEEAAYNAEVDLIERLRALLAAQPANGDKT